MLRNVSTQDSRLTYQKMIDGVPFTLSCYSDNYNHLLLKSSNIFTNCFDVIDNKKAVMVAVVGKFENEYLYCQTPFATNFITFPIPFLSIKLIHVKSVS